MKIVLISFISRSGSTLLANNLSKDSRFCVCPEAEILTTELLQQPHKNLTFQIYKKLKKAGNVNYKLKYWNLEFPAYSKQYSNIDLFIKLLEVYKNRNKPMSDFVVFKSEMLEKFDITTLSSFYKIILVRDPRAVFLSQKSSKASFGKVMMNKNPIRIAHKTDRLFYSYQEKIQDEFLLKFEDYICQHFKTNGLLTNFFGIEKFNTATNNALLNHIPEEQKHLHKNIGGEIDIAVLDKWKNQLNINEIYTIEQHCQVLEAVGYKKVVKKNQINKIDYSRYLIKVVKNDIGNKIKKALIKINI